MLMSVAQAAQHRKSAHEAAAKPAARAAEPTPTKAAEPEKKVAAPEAVETIDVVEPSVAADDDDKPLTLTTVLSHLHPAVVHLPIAWVMLLFFADVGAFVLKRREIVAAGLYLSVLALLSFAPAALTGLLRLGEEDPTTLGPALVHRNLMYGSAALCSMVVGIRVVRKNAIDGALRWIYLALVTATLLAVSVGAHLGGKLVYGDRYLPF